MLSFIEWTEAIYSRRNKLEEIADRMKYQKLQIRGPVAPVVHSLPSSLCINAAMSDDDIRAKYATDDILIKLGYEEEKLKKEISYIENVGELPPENALEYIKENEK